MTSTEVVLFNRICSLSRKVMFSHVSKPEMSGCHVGVDVVGQLPRAVTCDGLSRTFFSFLKKQLT